MSIRDRKYRLKIAQDNFDRAKQQKTPVEKAAKKLARTGTHRDLTRYLKARRNNR